MATVNVTWGTVPGGGCTDVGDSASVTYADVAAEGGKFTTTTKSATSAERARETTTTDTWETWGVPPGSTVQQIQITANNWAKKLVANTKLSSHTISIRVVNASGTPVSSTDLIAAATLGTTTDAGYVAQAGGSAEAVLAAYSASSTIVKLELGYSVTTGGTSSAASVDQRFNGITITITYQPAEPDGSLPTSQPSQSTWHRGAKALWAAAVLATALGHAPAPPVSAALVASEASTQVQAYFSPWSARAAALLLGNVPPTDIPTAPPPSGGEGPPFSPPIQYRPFTPQPRLGWHASRDVEPERMPSSLSPPTWRAFAPQPWLGWSAAADVQLPGVSGEAPPVPPPIQYRAFELQPWLGWSTPADVPLLPGVSGEAPPVSLPVQYRVFAPQPWLGWSAAVEMAPGPGSEASATAQAFFSPWSGRLAAIQLGHAVPPDIGTAPPVPDAPGPWKATATWRAYQPQPQLGWQAASDQDQAIPVPASMRVAWKPWRPQQAGWQSAGDQDQAAQFTAPAPLRWNDFRRQPQLGWSQPTDVPVVAPTFGGEAPQPGNGPYLFRGFRPQPQLGWVTPTDVPPPPTFAGEAPPQLRVPYLYRTFPPQPWLGWNPTPENGIATEPSGGIQVEAFFSPWSGKIAASLLRQAPAEVPAVAPTFGGEAPPQPRFPYLFKGFSPQPRLGWTTPTDLPIVVTANNQVIPDYEWWQREPWLGWGQALDVPAAAPTIPAPVSWQAPVTWGRFRPQPLLGQTPAGDQGQAAPPVLLPQIAWKGWSHQPWLGWVSSSDQDQAERPPSTWTRVVQWQRFAPQPWLGWAAPNEQDQSLKCADVGIKAAVAFRGFRAQPWLGWASSSDQDQATAPAFATRVQWRGFAPQPFLGWSAAIDAPVVAPTFGGEASQQSRFPYLFKGFSPQPWLGQNADMSQTGPVVAPPVSWQPTVQWRGFSPQPWVGHAAATDVPPAPPSPSWEPAGQWHGFRPQPQLGQATVQDAPSTPTPTEPTPIVWKGWRPQPSAGWSASTSEAGPGAPTVPVDAVGLRTVQWHGFGAQPWLGQVAATDVPAVVVTAPAPVSWQPTPTWHGFSPQPILGHGAASDQDQAPSPSSAIPVVWKGWRPQPELGRVASSEQAAALEPGLAWPNTVQWHGFAPQPWLGRNPAVVSTPIIADKPSANREFHPRPYLYKEFPRQPWLGWQRSAVGSTPVISDKPRQYPQPLHPYLFVGFRPQPWLGWGIHDTATNGTAGEYVVTYRRRRR